METRLEIRYWLYDEYTVNGKAEAEVFVNGKTFDELKAWIINDIVDIMYNNVEIYDISNVTGWARDIINVNEANCIFDLKDYIDFRGWHVAKTDLKMESKWEAD